MAPSAASCLMFNIGSWPRAGCLLCGFQNSECPTRTYAGKMHKNCISPNEKIGRYTFISSFTNVVDNLSNGKNFALKVSKILPLSTLWKPSHHRRGLGDSGTRQCSESLEGQWDKVAEIGYGSELMAI